MTSRPRSALTPEQLAQLQASFEHALDLPPAERDTYLRAEGQRDTEFATRVRALLEAHTRTGSVLHSPVSADLGFDDAGPDRRIGRQIGAYEIVRLIGAGGMGMVYEAVRADDQYRKRVAIKFLSTHATSDTAIQRFRRERQILANLTHPNIAALLDGGVSDDGQPYFVMEYTSRASRSRAGPTLARSRCRRASSSSGRSARPYSTRTRVSSCIATSSRRTSSSPETAS